jgi:hypothetical protein
MASEFAAQHPIYVNYSYHSYTSGAVWHLELSADASIYTYGNTYGVRSNLYNNIYPCITIELSKDDYVNN